MKKTLCLILASLLLVTLIGCGGSSAAPTTAETTVETTTPTPTEILYNTNWDGKTLKVLCVGNSFARNATKYLYEIAEAHGLEEIVVGVLHIGGCTVQKHWNNAQSGDAAYKYYKNNSGDWKLTENATLLYGLQDEDWDVITITQGQGYYGIPSSYDGCLEELVAYLEENKTNPDAQLAFHMTWAFPPNSTNERFNHYANDQMIMYQCITDTARDRVLTVEGIDFLLPSGTAIQNVRAPLGEVFFDDDLFHLNGNGEYVAGYTWFVFLTGQKVDTLAYTDPIAAIKSMHQPILEAVNATLDNPLTITEISK